MESREFFQRFADTQEIGRDITDTHVCVFYDNGTDVGQWREQRSTTVGVGSVLAADHARMARYWFAKLSLSDRSTASPSQSRGGRKP